MNFLHVLVCVSLGQAPKAERHHASLLAYNVQYDGPEVMKKIDAIRDSKADVVCLSELTRPFEKHVIGRLGDKYRYRHFATTPSGTWGIGVASRLKIISAKTFEQKPHAMPAIEAQLEGGLTVVCVHLFPPMAKRNKKQSSLDSMKANAELRAQQAKQLVLRFEKNQAPIVILGDFNEGRHDDALVALNDGGYLHACAGENARCGATFPGPSLPWPALFEIDHILGKHVKFSEAHVVRAGGSDHYPVIAKVTF